MERCYRSLEFKAHFSVFHDNDAFGMGWIFEGGKLIPALTYISRNLAQFKPMFPTNGSKFEFQRKKNKERTTEYR